MERYRAKLDLIGGVIEPSEEHRIKLMQLRINLYGMMQLLRGDDLRYFQTLISEVFATMDDP